MTIKIFFLKKCFFIYKFAFIIIFLFIISATQSILKNYQNFLYVKIIIIFFHFINENNNSDSFFRIYLIYKSWIKKLIAQFYYKIINFVSK